MHIAYLYAIYLYFINSYNTLFNLFQFPLLILNAYFTSSSNINPGPPVTLDPSLQQALDNTIEKHLPKGLHSVISMLYR